MGSDGSADQMRRELQELMAETARLREEAKLLEQRIQQLAKSCDGSRGAGGAAREKLE